MKQLSAMAWKEWREAQAYFWTAVGIFIGLPVVGGLEWMLSANGRPFYITASPWVLALGGVLAVFVGVGVTTQELGGPLEDFWRSRPVNPILWMLVKYLVGLVIVLATCIGPLLLQSIDPRGGNFLSHHSYATLAVQWWLVYSIAFLAGLLVHRGTPAALIALSALLLIHMLPVTLGSWRLSTNWLAFKIELPIAAVTLILALISAHRQWHLEADRKAIFGVVAAAILILIGSASLQLGANLPVLQSINLSPNSRAESLFLHEGRGWLLSRTFINHVYGKYQLRLLRLTPNHIQVDAPQSVSWPWCFSSDVVRSPEHPMVGYTTNTEKIDGKWETELMIIHHPIQSGRIGSNFRPITIPWVSKNDKNFTRPILYAWRDRLYAVGSKLVIFDISNPLKPRIISAGPLIAPLSHRSPDRAWIFRPSPIPGLPPAQRLELTLRMSFVDYAFNGKILCLSGSGATSEYRLTKLTDTEATFDRVGISERSSLEIFFGYGAVSFIKLNGDLLYVGNGTGNLYNRFNARITVYDTRGPNAPRVVGHFAAPNIGAIHFLPDGRAIVAGNKIWLVGPPPGWNVKEPRTQ